MLPITSTSIAARVTTSTVSVSVRPLAWAGPEREG
jgi:hypothetical protein